METLPLVIIILALTNAFSDAFEFNPTFASQSEPIYIVAGQMLLKQVFLLSD